MTGDWKRSFQGVTKFSYDVMANIVAFGVMGICGLLLYFLILHFYGKAALGIFNQVYAVFIFFSQLAVFGVHLSVGRAVAEHSERPDVVGNIIGSAFLTVSTWAGIMCGFMFLSSSWFGTLLKSPGTAGGLLCAVWALWFFALNKVFLAVFNGYRHMRLFAFFQGMRYVLLIACFFVFWRLGISAEQLPFILTLEEGLLLSVILATLLFLKIPIRFNAMLDWGRRHVVFGLKGFLSGTLTEINTRVDILLLGLFLSDSVVGIYSIGAAIAEGFLQLLYVIRLNVNPLLAKLSAAGDDRAGLAEFLREGIRAAYQWLAPFLLAGMVAAFALLHFLWDAPESPMVIMVTGIILVQVMTVCGYIPFSMLPVQADQPGWYTLLMAAALTVNAAADILLIPVLGLYGAAVGMGLSFIAAALFLKLYSVQQLKIRL